MAGKLTVSLGTRERNPAHPPGSCSEPASAARLDPPCLCSCAGKRKPQVLGAQHAPPPHPVTLFPGPALPRPAVSPLGARGTALAPPGPCGVRSVAPPSCVPSRYQAFHVSPNRRRRPHFKRPRKVVQAPGHQGTSGRACSLLAISNQVPLKLDRRTSRPTDSLCATQAALVGNERARPPSRTPPLILPCSEASAPRGALKLKSLQGKGVRSAHATFPRGYGVEAPMLTSSLVV